MTGMNERNRDKSTEKVIIYTRQHPRYTTSIFARAYGQTAMQEGRGNVSVGGFCFEAEGTWEAGCQVELLFRLPGAGFWLRGTGVVLACDDRDGRYAVRGRFESFDTGDPDLLVRWSEALERFGILGRPADSANEPDEEILFSTEIG